MRVNQQELPINDWREPNTELGALLRRAREGSAAAFGELAERIRGQIVRWASSLTHDRDDADDVAQLVLLRLATRLDEFEGRSRFHTWLYRITRNVALNERRRVARRMRLLRELGEDIASRPTDQAAQDDGHIAYLLQHYTQSLSGREREAYELVDLRGLSPNAAAEQLGVKPVTVRVWLTRARRRVRLRMLEEYPELLEDYEP